MAGPPPALGSAKLNTGGGGHREVLDLFGFQKEGKGVGTSFPYTESGEEKCSREKKVLKDKKQGGITG